MWFSTTKWRRQWHPTPVLLPGKPHGQRSLVGCSPWGGQESDTTERPHFHFSLLCIGEGNGNPLQCSCLENPRDGGAWWAAVYWVAESRTRLKRLSSRSSSINNKRTLSHFYLILIDSKIIKLYLFQRVKINNFSLFNYSRNLAIRVDTYMKEICIFFPEVLTQSTYHSYSLCHRCSHIWKDLASYFLSDII